MLNYLLSKSTIKNIEVVVDVDRLRPIDADLQIPNTNKFKNHTGWEVEIPFEKTMDDLLEYWRNKIKLGRKFLNR
jgi:GDPmannose 4,6-dehydratase